MKAIQIPQYCTFEILEGTATHVGMAYYPWEEVIENRKAWGQLPQDWAIEKRGHLSALHEAMVDPSYIGRRALVVSRETGRFLWADVVDAMAAGKRHPNPGYHDRIIDLTPEMFGWMLGFHDGPRGRGGQEVIVMFPQCEGIIWPSYGNER